MKLRWGGLFLSKDAPRYKCLLRYPGEPSIKKREGTIKRFINNRIIARA